MHFVGEGRHFDDLALLVLWDKTLINAVNTAVRSSLFTKMVETHKKEKKYSNNKNNLNYKQWRTYLSK